MSVAAQGGGNSGAAAGATTLIVVVLAAIMVSQGVDTQRVMLCASLTLIMYTLTTYTPIAGLISMFTFLAFLGAIKRYLIPVLGYSSFDPLILVVPAVTGIFFVNRIIARDIPRDSPISKTILALILVMTLEIFNPLQGGLTVGFAGALFYILPLMMFYIGRSHGTIALLRPLFNAVVYIGILAGIYGLYQTWFGFTDIERQWLDLTRNDIGLHLKDATRVFSFLSSFAEYCCLLIVAMTISFAYFLRGNRAAIVPTLFFFFAIVLSSSRGSVANSIFACTLMWAVQRGKWRTWVPRLVVALVIGAVTISLGLSQASQVKVDPITDDLIGHQAQGLSNPLDSKSSTGGDHVSLVAGGIGAGIRNPLGLGLGATTLAAGKFGTVGTGTEGDISNIFVSTGIVGGCIFVYLYFVVGRAVLLRWERTRNHMILCTMGILGSQVFFWLISGHYSITMLIWFAIGVLDKQEAVDIRSATIERESKLRPIGMMRRPAPAPVGAAAATATGQPG